MVKLLSIRVLRLLATLIAVSFLTFFMVSLLPGDPVNAILPPDAPRTPEVEARVRAELNLDEPLVVRYGIWLKDAVIHQDLGKSFVNDQPVATTIRQRLPVTAQLALGSVFLALAMAIPIGVLGAYRQGLAADKASSAAVQVALSLPNFITGIFLIWLLSVKFNLLPATGWNRISEGIGENLKTAIMPCLALAMTQMAIFSRLLRSDMINTLQENFVLSAKAKGLSDRYILFRHAFRPSSLSLITIAGINFGALLGGTVVIETLFALPGLGFKLINAINQRDIMVIQGVTVFIATVYVIINTLVDLLYLAIDPRIRKS